MVFVVRFVDFFDAISTALSMTFVTPAVAAIAAAGASLVTCVSLEVFELTAWFNIWLINSALAT